MISTFMQVATIFEEVCGEVFQEIFALVLFAASVVFFKYLDSRRRRSRLSQKAVKQAFDSEPLPKLHSAAPARNLGGTAPIAPQRNGKQRIQEAEARMLSQLDQREFTSALNTYRSFERDGSDRLFTSEAMFGSFIQSAVRVNKLDVVERMLRTMSRNGMTPSLDFWHSTLKMLSSRKHFSIAISVFTAFGHMLPNDKVIFSCLINAALESTMKESLPAMLARYQQCDLRAEDYVTVFRTCVAIGDADAAEKLFLDLASQTTPLMLNLLLLACINIKQPKRAMDILSKAHEFETETALQGGESSPKASQIVDTVSYNTVMKGFAASGDVQCCLECFLNMQKHGLEPDDVTLASLLDISLTDHTCGMTNRLVQMLLESRQGRPLHASTCHLFIKHLIRAQQLPKAIEVYEALKSCSGAQPTIATFSILTKALVDACDLERALLLLDDMASVGESPDEIIFTHLLEGCRLVGNLALGERLFEDMLAAGVRPSEYTLTMMVKLHGRCGAFEKAYQLVECWEAKHGMKPSVIHYTCIMSGCLRNKAYDQAWAAFSLMEKQGVRPDEMMMSTLVPAMAASQEFGRVLHLVRLALRRIGGIRVPAAALNNALAQMLAAPSAAQEADEMKLLMEKAGVAVTRRRADQGSGKIAVASSTLEAAAPWKRTFKK